MLKLGMAAIAMALLLAPQTAPLDTREAIPYFIEDGKGVPGYRDSDRELAKLALDAWSRESATRTQVAGTINLATPGTVESSASTQGGWAAGAGIEWGVTPNLSVKAEYLHYDFRNSRFVFPLANRRWEDNLTKDTVKLGVNWRLNWGSDPVGRKY